MDTSDYKDEDNHVGKEYGGVKYDPTTKLDRMKTHFANNKRAYITGGVCLLVGSVGGMAIKSGGIQIVDALKVQIASPTTNNVVQTLARRGHPGNVIQCLETGETFASQNRAAAANGIAPADLSRHLAGVIESVKGLHFTKLGEATS